MKKNLHIIVLGLSICVFLSSSCHSSSSIGTITKNKSEASVVKVVDNFMKDLCSLKTDNLKNYINDPSRSFYIIKDKENFMHEYIDIEDSNIDNNTKNSINIFTKIIYNTMKDYMTYKISDIDKISENYYEVTVEFKSLDCSDLCNAVFESSDYLDSITKNINEDELTKEATNQIQKVFDNIAKNMEIETERIYFTVEEYGKNWFISEGESNFYEVRRLLNFRRKININK